MVDYHASMSRRQPRQERSKQTVDDILESTAQVLKQVGIAQTTTDRIAARAGLSVGSLYQYFPNKLALYEALMKRHFEHVTNIGFSLAQRLVDASAAEFPDVLAAVMLTAERTDPQLSAILHQIAAMHTSVAMIEVEHTRAFEMAMGALLQQKQGMYGLRPDLDPELAGRILMRALAGLARRTMELDPSLMASEEFATEVRHLIAGYLFEPSRKT
jgi:AcrR family transcriptional regulator